MLNDYDLCQRNLVAKAIEELQFEDILTPLDHGSDQFSLCFGDHLYEFKGCLGASKFNALCNSVTEFI